MAKIEIVQENAVISNPLHLGAFFRLGHLGGI
jgi:hypothetical protein